MKKMHQFMTVLAAATLAACSSMDISDEKALSENFPADFNAAEYSSLHPVLHSLEVRDFVTSYNTKLKDSLGSEYTALMNADNLAFAGDSATGVMGDTANLHKILVDQRLGGYSEQQWNDIWLSTTTTKSDTVWSKRMKTCKVTVKKPDSAGVKLEIAVDSVDTDSLGGFLVIYGKADSAAESKAFVLSDSTYEFFLKSDKYDSTVVSVDTKDVEIKGNFSSKQASYVKTFNMVGVPKDSLYDRLLAVPVDEFAISYQYTVFGRSHGWAYRKCTDEEKTHPTQSELYPMKKYYCDDNGVAREI